jgi:hypothetical protein
MVKATLPTLLAMAALASLSLIAAAHDDTTGAPLSAPPQQGTNVASGTVQPTPAPAPASGERRKVDRE